jgi:peptidase E
MEPENPLLDEFVLSLARRERPRVCYVGTAGGDSELYAATFYRAFAALDCRPADLGLFERRVADLRAFVLDQDVVYVGGGNTASLLAVWRAHGLDAVLAEAWREGVVLCGISAGMNCWFEQSVTDSFDVAFLAPLHDGLGLLAGSACPHYDGEERRPPGLPRPRRPRRPRRRMGGRRRRRARVRGHRARRGRRLAPGRGGLPGHARRRRRRRGAPRGALPGLSRRLSRHRRAGRGARSRSRPAGGRPRAGR